MDHTHIIEPYGWVQMTDCRVEEKTVPTWDARATRAPDGSHTYDKTRQQLYVIGTVTASSWVGALLCGVPVSKPTADHFPAGSIHECPLRHPSDLDHKTTRTTR